MVRKIKQFPSEKYFLLEAKVRGRKSWLVDGLRSCKHWLCLNSATCGPCVLQKADLWTQIFPDGSCESWLASRFPSTLPPMTLLPMNSEALPCGVWWRHERTCPSSEGHSSGHSLCLKIFKQPSRVVCVCRLLFLFLLYSIKHSIILQSSVVAGFSFFFLAKTLRCLSSLDNSPSNEQGHLQQIRLPRALSSLTLHVSADEEGNLFCCFISLVVKSLFLLSDLNLTTSLVLVWNHFLLSCPNRQDRALGNRSHGGALEETERRLVISEVCGIWHLKWSLKWSPILHIFRMSGLFCLYVCCILEKFTNLLHLVNLHGLWSAEVYRHCNDTWTVKSQQAFVNLSNCTVKFLILRCDYGCKMLLENSFVLLVALSVVLFVSFCCMGGFFLLSWIEVVLQ